VVIVLDTTQSMNNTDNDSQCNASLSCALSGIRTLLGTLSPCVAGAPGSTCGAVTGGNVANPVDEVGLMVFPGLTSTSLVPVEYSNKSGTLTSSDMQTYNNSPVYQIIPPSSDYRDSDTASLNTSSDIVIAVGGGSSGYGPVGRPGGPGNLLRGRD
jgi:hypothetical protein